MKNFKLPHRWIGMVLLLAMFSTPASYGLAQGTMVAIDPSSRTVAVDATTTMDIRIENVTGMIGAEVHLTFNSTALQVVDADPNMAGVQIQSGTFLKPDFIAQNAVDEAAGTINFSIAQIALPVDGSGVLATITFKGKAAGTSTVNFATVTLSNQDGQVINAGTRNGNVTVTGPIVTPPTDTPTHTPTPTGTLTPTPTGTLTPTPTPTPTSPSGGVPGYHTVRSKETLYCIARAYGVDPKAIARRNNILNPSLIYAGTRLAIPNAPYTLPPGRVCLRQFEPGTIVPTCRSYHTVAMGENLYRISLRYGVSMWAIAEANHITNLSLIFVGQVLCIP